MLFLSVIEIIGIVVLTLIRTIALSSWAEKLLPSIVWEMDVGPRYGWLIICPIFIALNFYHTGSFSALFLFSALWILGLASIWLLPPLLVK